MIDQLMSRLESRSPKRPGCPRATWSGFRSKQSARNASVSTGSIAPTERRVRRRPRRRPGRCRQRPGRCRHVGVLVVRVGEPRPRPSGLSYSVVMSSSSVVVSSRSDMRSPLVARDGGGYARGEHRANATPGESASRDPLRPQIQPSSLNWGKPRQQTAQATSATTVRTTWTSTQPSLAPAEPPRDEDERASDPDQGRAARRSSWKIVNA